VVNIYNLSKTNYILLFDFKNMRICIIKKTRYNCRRVC